MKVFRVSTLVAFSLAVASGAGLFVISQRVQRAEHHLAALEKDKAGEADSIRVLRAEWDYLNRPDRLEALAHRYLNMEAPDLNNVTADPAALTATVQVDAPIRKRPARMMPQPAVYHAPSAVQAPAASPSPDQAPPETVDQGSFDDLIHNLSNGGGGQ
jgi:hypothetical protein